MQPIYLRPRSDLGCVQNDKQGGIGSHGMQWLASLPVECGQLLELQRVSDTPKSSLNVLKLQLGGRLVDMC